MTTIVLTDDQRKKIVQDAKGMELLTPQEVEKIATKVNDKINLPFLNTDQEQVVFVKAVRWLDKQLYQLLPNELYECIRMTESGINEDEADTIRVRITKTINKLVDLPFLSESQEEKLFGIFIGIITTAMIKGNKL